MITDDARELINDVCMMTDKQVKALSATKRETIRLACKNVNNHSMCTEEDIQDVKNARFLLKSTAMRKPKTKAA